MCTERMNKQQPGLFKNYTKVSMPQFQNKTVIFERKKIISSL